MSLHKDKRAMESNILSRVAEKKQNAWFFFFSTAGYWQSPAPYLVTIGSAAWFGPQRPNNPLPVRPVLPAGLLKQMPQYVTQTVLNWLQLQIRPATPSSSDL